MQSPGAGILDLMKSISSVNSMTSGNVLKPKNVPRLPDLSTNYVNIIPKSQVAQKTQRKTTNRSEVKPLEKIEFSRSARAPLTPVIPGMPKTSSNQSPFFLQPSQGTKPKTGPSVGLQKSTPRLKPKVMAKK